ncbi:hypothetical protein LguiA_012626 [Lonicera macranthoides]
MFEVPKAFEMKGLRISVLNFPTFYAETLASAEILKSRNGISPYKSESAQGEAAAGAMGRRCGGGGFHGDEKVKLDLVVSKSTVLRNGKKEENLKSKEKMSYSIGIAASDALVVNMGGTYRKVTPPPPPLSSLLLSSKFSSATTSITLKVNPNYSSPLTTKNQTQRNSTKSRSNDLQDALFSFHRLLNSRSRLKIYSLTKVLGSIVKMGEYQTVLSLIQKMQLSGVEDNVYTISIAINCYCHLNQVDLGFALLGSIFKHGFVPHVVTFNTLMKGLFAQGKSSEAEKLFKKLLSEKLIEPDVFTYGTVINGLCKSGNTLAAIEFLKTLEKHNFEANIVLSSYNAIIDSLCKDRMVSDARNLFDEMIEKGISPDVVTYTSLIHGLFNLGLWEEVNKLLRQMVEQKVSPNLLTFSIIVDALCKEGMVREAEGVVEFMIQLGEVPSLVTYTSLMDGYCLRGQMENARKVFDSMVNRGLEPNIISYCILIKGYCKNRRIDEAMHLFKEVPCKGLNYNVVIYNIMLQGLFENGRGAAARELFDEVFSKGL